MQVLETGFVAPLDQDINGCKKLPTSGTFGSAQPQEQIRDANTQHIRERALGAEQRNAPLQHPYL